MSNSSFSSDLCANKDVLLSISTFLSLKQLFRLRATSKQINSWLSDYSSFSWKKRVELAFPTTFEAVLQEDAKMQMLKLHRVDTLVDSGHQVSLFSLDVPSVRVNQKYQIPWVRTLFLIVYNNTSVMAFDATSGKDVCRVDLAELKEIEFASFDIQNHKIGFIGVDGQDNSLMKVYSFDNNELKFVTDYTSPDALDNDMFTQVYGEYIIVHNDEQLSWHSLSSGDLIKEIDLPEDDENLCLELSIVKPEIYIVKTEESTYCIEKIDCTLQAAEPVEVVHRARLGIEMDNYGDGVQSSFLTETEHGRILNIYLMGTGDTAFRAYDLDAQKIVASMHSDSYNTVRFNPGSRYYSIESDSGVVAIMESGKMYEDDYVFEQEKYDIDDNEEDEDEDDPTKGAYFKFKADVQNYKWLNKDLFTLNTIVRGCKNHCLFFSISKRAIIGSISYEIIEDIFIADKTIVAFTDYGGIYRVKLDMDFDEKYQGKADAEKMDVVVNESSSKNKKRKASEMSTDKGVQKIRKAAKYS